MELILFLPLLLATLCLAQMPKKPPILPLTKDLPFIKCETCQKAAKAMFKLVKQKRDEVKPSKLGEEEVLSIVEKICDSEDDTHGLWISKLDIVEEKSGLKLQEHAQRGKCREECKTIAKSCEETIGDIDTDLGEILWKNDLKLSSFINEACYSLSNACKKNNLKYVKGKRRDFQFAEMTEKDVEAMNLMKNMKGMPGMPGLEMYTPEDLENMREQLGVNPDNDPPMSSSEDESASPGNSKVDEKVNEHQHQHHRQSTQLGFFDTIKSMGSDVVSKIKGVFGFSKKSEL